MKTTYSLFILLLFFSCNQFQRRDKTQDAIARVGDTYLYKDELSTLGIQNLNAEDSTKLVDSYVNSWVRRQTILQNANKYLSPEQLKEVEGKVADYRESLLSLIYETQITQERIDTTVTQDEIETYYEANQSDFAIQEPIVKFISVQNDKPFTSQRTLEKKIERYLQDGNDFELKEYCSFSAITCYYDANNWVPATTFFETLGLERSSVNRKLLKAGKLQQLNGENYYYLYQLLAVKSKGNYPIEFVADNIKTLIIRKREKQFLEELRAKIYETAKNNNEIEIYEK